MKSSAASDRDASDGNRSSNGARRCEFCNSTLHKTKDCRQRAKILAGEFVPRCDHCKYFGHSVEKCRLIQSKDRKPNANAGHKNAGAILICKGPQALNA